MGILHRLRKLFEKRASVPGDEYFTDSLPGWLTGLMPTSSGVKVTEDTALQASAVWACVRVLSESVASLPLHLYRRKEKGKERAPEHPLYRLLHNQPNPEMTSFDFRECSMAHRVTWGNSYASIVRNNAGMPIELWPLSPSRVKEWRDKQGKLWYIYTLPDGTKRKLPPEEVYHVHGLSINGLSGLSVIGYAREAIGMALATEKYGNVLFKNGARPSGVLEHPGILGDGAADRLAENWSRIYQGLDNANKTAILEEGMQYKMISIPPDDAQFLETRKYQVAEIARMYRVPLHMIGDLDRATNNNIEHQSIEFVMHSLRPWLVREEQQIWRQLIPERDQAEYFAEYLIDGLLRGDAKSRNEAREIMHRNGALNADEWRGGENMNPIADGSGQIYYMQNIWMKRGQEPPKIPTGQEPPPKEEPPKDEKKSKPEKRASSHVERVQLRRTFAPLFKQAGERIIRREVVDVRRAIEKYFPKRGQVEFKEWLDEFYAKHPEYIEKNMMPLVHSYGDAVRDAAIKEVGLEFVKSEEYEQFLRGYMDTYVKRHVGSSIGQLKKIVRESEPDVLEQDLLVRLDEWEQKRPDQIEMNEPVRLGGAVARSVWTLVGVTRFVWMALGADPCPFCEDLGGQVVGVEQAFVLDGSIFEPEGADHPMVIHGSKMHEPLHAGCVCAVGPG